VVLFRKHVNHETRRSLQPDLFRSMRTPRFLLIAQAGRQSRRGGQDVLDAAEGAAEAGT
jgi:hypothetical protein